MATSWVHVYLLYLLHLIESTSKASQVSRLNQDYSPVYLFQLYRSMWREKNDGKAPSVDAEIVRSLSVKAWKMTPDDLSVAFDLSGLSRDETVKSAELRLRFEGFTERSSLTLYHQTLDLCQGMATGICRLYERVGSTNVVLSSTGNSTVSSLDVTDLVNTWVESSPTLRHKVTCTVPLTGKFQSVTQTAGSECQGWRGFEINEVEPATLLLFTREHAGSHERGMTSSLLRTAESSKYVASRPHYRTGHRQRRIRKHPQGAILNRKTTRNSGRLQEQSDGARSRTVNVVVGWGGVFNVPHRTCHRVDFYIDFDELGWGKWIVYPRRYNAFRCEGSCPSPVNELYLPTNHAYMQSLVHFHHPRRVPSPCCAPTHLSALSMLYQESGHVVLRHHKELIVEQCGCL